jgi:hypothetical protein
MTADELNHSIVRALVAGASLASLHAILVQFAKAGAQAEAIEVLERIRDTEPEFEDRVLEILDFATGFCRPEHRIW